MRPWLVVVATVLSCGRDHAPATQASATQASAAPAPVPVPVPVPAVTLRQRPASIGYLTLKALHMDCAETCPVSARVALQRVPAVYEVGVDLDHEALYVSYDRSAGDGKLAAAPMLDALRAIGFDPWFKAEGWPSDVSAANVAVLPRGN